ncbi:MAG: hypothetical protein Q7R72_01225 [bacterium]|nr:hypothetical protein [bacterium]
MTTKTKIFFAIALVTIGIAGRLLPHAWNFAPIVAIGIFSGAYLGQRFAFAVPVSAMIISDIFLGFYSWQMNLTVYLAMGLSGLVGIFLQKKKNPTTIALASISGSTIFFLITNGAVWYFTSMYEPTISGLYASYIAGIPFFRNAIVGDVWYSFALFGTYEMMKVLYYRFAPTKTLVS